MAYPVFHPASRAGCPLMLDVATFHREFPGESRYVEFKQGPSRDRIARAVAAFSNTEGGVLLVGVAPDGMPVGTNVDGEALASLHRTVSSVHDGGRYEIIPIEVGDRCVVVISVARREQGFAQTADGQVVVRRDAMNTSLIGTQLADFVTRHALARFETTPTSCSLDAADDALLAELAQVHGWSAPLPQRLVERGW